MDRFYTYAPIEYPYILRNIKQKPKKCYHEIVDIGIYDLLKPPYYYPNERFEIWEKMGVNGWKIVPDYPDINKSPYNNINETKKLHLKYYNPKDPQHLPVIQSHFDDVDSLIDYINWFKGEYGVVDKVCVGSIASLNNIKKVTEILTIVREEFPSSFIHALGLKFHHMRKNHKIINSYDSTAWTFPRTPNRSSCKNQNMRVEYFYEYMDYLHQYLKDHNGWVINI